jgi:PDZ domain-containing protein
MVSLEPGVTEQPTSARRRFLPGRRPRTRRSRRVWIVTLVILLALVVGGWVFVDNGTSNYWAFAPGSAPRITSNPQCRENGGGGALAFPNGTPCALLIVPPSQSHSVDGTLYMVDVLVGPATPVQYILSKLGLLHTFDKGTQLVPKSAVLGTTPPAQLACQNAQQMSGATSSATVVALKHLGYHIVENDLGAQLQEVAPNTPASAAGLRCNDLVVGAGGVRIKTWPQLVGVVHAAHPGQALPLTVQRVGPAGKSETVKLTAHLTGTPASAGGAAQPEQAFLGVEGFTNTTYVLPFNVVIKVGDIGGPSAGLALTLGLLDILSNGDLTGGHRVAATGTMNLDGTVGDVGGVAQKAVAVRHAGAQLFLVPPQEYQAAKSQAGSMKVEAVSTLQQALDDLEAIGGHVPPPTPASSHGA